MQPDYDRHITTPPRELHRRQSSKDTAVCRICGVEDDDTVVCCGSTRCLWTAHRECAVTCEKCNGVLCAGHEQYWEHAIWCPGCLVDAKRVKAEEDMQLLAQQLIERMPVGDYTGIHLAVPRTKD